MTTILGSGEGEIKKVIEIEEGIYGYMLTDSTYIPHSSIISASTHRILKGGLCRKSIRRKRASRRRWQNRRR